MQFSDLRGRVAIVTGASRLRGIGAATCRALAAQGCAIFFTTYPPYDATTFPESTTTMDPEKLAAELRGMGVPVAFMEVDLAQPNCATRIFDRVERLLGPASILVNNAAHSARDGFQELDASGLDAHYAVNVRATALLSVEFARRHSKGPGRIINLTSGQEREPLAGELAYAATKGAISAFTRSLAREVAYKGIRVNAVDPGPTDTGWMSDQLKSQIIASSANGRLALSEDAARLIVFLASEAAERLNGEVIHARGI
jgi:3-oxoacyl-[acyl-carrier protein] reductase